MNSTVTVVESFDEWSKLSKQWNHLLGGSRSDTAFLTWQWLYSWAECFLSGGRKLFILLVNDDNGKLMGVAPWYVNHRGFKPFLLKQIEFLGTPESGSDYLDVFAARGREEEVAGAIYDFLLGDGASYWDCMALREIPSNSLFLLHFLNKIKADGKHAEINPASFCPRALLPKSESDYFSGAMSKRAKRFRQELRILNRTEAVEHRTFTEGGLDEPIKEFFRLYEEKAGWEGKHLRELIEKAIERSTNEPMVQIDLLAGRDQYFAGFLHLRHGDTLSMYLMAVDKEFNPKVSIGNVLIGLCISSAIGNGISVYDFLKGEEEYKFHWSNEGRRALELLFGRRRLVPLVVGLARLARYAGKMILR
ncbi:MAG: GNAT family N-acetyltransferase [Deltaproteobacteria bacterium]|nr:GNAT family N-acetyltransferase [Deltaproteobacteria bacterium]